MHKCAGMRVWKLGWHCAKSVPEMKGECFAKFVPE